jgi:hypothetical protein
MSKTSSRQTTQVRDFGGISGGMSIEEGVGCLDLARSMTSPVVLFLRFSLNGLPFDEVEDRNDRSGELDGLAVSVLSLLSFLLRESTKKVRLGELRSIVRMELISAEEISRESRGRFRRVSRDGKRFDEDGFAI